MADLSQIAKVLNGEVAGGGVRAPGPGHSAKDRSLSILINPNAPDGFIVHSFAGDDPIVCRDYVRERLGMEPFKPNGRRKPASREDIAAFMDAAMASERRESPKGQLVAIYDYTEANGDLLYQALRYEPKNFSQRRPDGKGGWIWNLDGIARVLYRLPGLLKYPDGTVFVTEGEKDSDRIASLGYCATTIAGGSWTGVDATPLTGRDVFVMQDNDAAGVKRALDAAQRLHGIAASVRIVLLPDLGPGEDISDWLDADRRRANQLVDICLDAPLWIPGEEPEAEAQAAADAPADPATGLGEWDAGDDTELPPPRGWLLGNSLARGFLSSVTAEGGIGKSALRYAQFLSLATGRELTGEHVFQRCRVLIVSLEDDAAELSRRILAARLRYGISAEDVKGWLWLSAPGAGAGKLMTVNNKGQLVRGKLADHLESVIVTRKIDVVCLDPFVKSHSVEENSNSAIDDVAQVLTDLCAKYNIAADIPHHVAKGTAAPGNASSGRGASAYRDATRLLYTLCTMGEDEAKAFGISEDERRQFIRLDSAKVNIVPARTAKWFRLVGVQLGNVTELYPNGDNVQTVEVWQPPDTWADLSTDLLNRILTTIDAGMPDGNRYSDGPNVGERAAWKAIVEHAPDKTEAQAREIVKIWVRNGVLVPFQYDNPVTRKKDVRGLKVSSVKRPG